MKKFLIKGVASVGITYGANYLMNYYDHEFTKYNKNKTLIEDQEGLNKKARLVGIKENVTFYEYNESSTRGINLFGIRLIVNLRKYYDDFDVYHELAHIKFNHKLKSSFINIFMVIFLYRKIYLSPILLFVKVATTKIFEKNADIYACSLSPVSDINKFIFLIERDVEIGKKLYNENFINKFIYTKNGDYIYEFHPYGTKRIEYLKEEVRKRMLLQSDNDK